VEQFAKDPSELIAHGKSQGYLTFDELNAFLPADDFQPDQLDNLLLELQRQGIELLDQPPAPAAPPPAVVASPAAVPASGIVPAPAASLPLPEREPVAPLEPPLPIPAG